MLRKILMAAVIGLGCSTPGLAQVALNQNDHITESLVAAQVGDTIRKTCASISARYTVVYTKMSELEDYARAEGYTEDEGAPVSEGQDRKGADQGAGSRVSGGGWGAVEGDEESFCQAGRDEIAKETLAGSLLKSWK